VDTFLASLTTVIAVIVGGLITFLTTWLLEKSRTARERAERWDVRRLDAFSAFARAVKEEVRILLRVASSLGFAQTRPLSGAEARELHQAAEHERSMLFESVLLLADSATIQAAQAWYYAAWDLQVLLLADGAQPTQEEFDRLYAAANEARKRFHVAARINLDILKNEPDPFHLSGAVEGARRF
jgi:hypothetical protein